MCLFLGYFVWVCNKKLLCFEIACSMGRGLCLFICSLLNVPNQTPSRPRAIKTPNTYRSISLSSLCVAGKYIIYVASQTQTSLIDAHFKLIFRRWTIRHGNFLRFGGVMPLLLYLVFHTLSLGTRAHSYIGKNVHAHVFCIHSVVFSSSLTYSEWHITGKKRFL